MKQQQPNFLPLISVVVIGLVALRLFGSSGPAPEPVPEPVPVVVASEHLTAALEYAAALQGFIQATIVKLQDGELSDEQQTRDCLATGRAAALKAAFMPVADRDAAAFEDGWTVEKQIERLQQMIK